MSTSREGGPDDAAKGRAIVLLGAGASVDAGLKVTAELAAAVVEKANERMPPSWLGTRPDWVRALNAVYAAMVGYRGVHGDSPLDAVNIETLISAIRLLRRRETHEVAPFVASWTASLSGFSSTEVPDEAGRAIADAISGMFDEYRAQPDHKIADAVARIARQATRPDLEKPLAGAETFVLRTIVDLLGDLDSVDYLAPLVDLAKAQTGGLDVITLNYDLTVETAAAQRGVEVNRGIESWHPGEDLVFPPTDDVLNLMKLHGSLDWRPAPRHGEAELQLEPLRLEVVPADQVRDGSGDNLPWIVVGDRDKLATNGPTLALNHAARTALGHADHLAIVGYSFGDDHINAMIRDWLAGDGARTISILDLHWPARQGYRPLDDFKTALTARYARQWGYGRRRLQPRVRLVAGTAADRLGEVLTARPAAAPDPVLQAAAAHRDGALRIELTWFGEALTDASVNAWKQLDGGPSAYRQAVLLSEDPAVANRPEDHWPEHHTVSHWETGMTVATYMAQGTRLPVQIELSGASAVGAQTWLGTIREDLTVDTDAGDPADPDFDDY